MKERRQKMKDILFSNIHVCMCEIGGLQVAQATCKCSVATTLTN